ncbi:RrF2 family transcriptional regulator [Paracoccus pacificus]|uniref:RrF2 family transcriptional regulator n=1 Tax=Paracoccus pacificus TaxID=1463598 RepID=A0ABW4R9U2_9RHOB
MRLTTFTDFGLRAMIRLAQDPQTPLSSAEIAEEFAISRHHLAKAMATLARAGLIVTRRGGGGGAILARPPAEISLGEVFRALNAEEPLVECFQSDGGHCVATNRCRLRARLVIAQEAFMASLDQSTLADVALEPQAFALEAAP